MMEIVFSDSACGSLKAAQNYSKGNFHGGCIGVIVTNQDGCEPTQQELEAAQNAVEERERLDWEEATPMGGNAQDVFGFCLILSIGDISKEDFANKRQKAIDALWSIYSDDPSDGTYDLTSHLQKELTTIANRAAQGEDIRIWYSNQPDELCGLYWLMAELQPLEGQLGTVSIVKLPEHEYRDNNTVISHTAWGEISPGEWHRYTAYAEPTTAVFRQLCASRWNSLCEENAPLRAVLNGQLQGVLEDIYDPFINREIASASEEFHEAVIIGNVLGKYQLGIGDAWVAHRIEKMIADGKLTAITTARQGEPSYRRKLKKNHLV